MRWTLLKTQKYRVIYRYLANKNGTVEFGLRITLQFILDSSKASYGGDVGNHAQWI